jgi:hypothetical protein
MGNAALAFSNPWNLAAYEKSSDSLIINSLQYTSHPNSIVNV